MLACLLGRLNSNLTLISDAGQVLASLAATPFDVLILDPDPVDESIPALLGRVREVARIKGGNPLRVVYIADPDDGESAQWLAAGIDVVLERPITLAALRDKALAVDWTADGREMASGHSAQREAT